MAATESIEANVGASSGFSVEELTKGKKTQILPTGSVLLKKTLDLFFIVWDGLRGNVYLQCERQIPKQPLLSPI
jgi:hypothetical protein